MCAREVDQRICRKTSELVINPEIGTMFDSIEETYDFYNLYS